VKRANTQIKTLWQTRRAFRLVFFLNLMLLYAGVLLWGIQHNLPYTGEIDEPFFVRPAMEMASSGDLNPGWFGHPGSTVIYPLAGIFHFWHSLVTDSSLWQANPDLAAHFRRNFAQYYYLGRLLTIAYALLTLPLIYKIGQIAFRRSTGFVGAWLFIFYSAFVSHAQMIRTDSASVFFIALALWFILATHQKGRVFWHVLAGLAIGHGIGTKFVLATLVPTYLLACALRVWQNRSDGGWKKEVNHCVIGLVMVVVGFAISTPYFFLDFQTAWENVLVEARSEHLGFDGLSPFGNFWFYVRSALPQIMTWPQFGMTLAAAALAVWRRQIPQILLLSFVVVYLAGISLSGLHWLRWALFVLPVLALFVAEGLRLLAWFLAERVVKRAHWYAYLFIGLVLLFSVRPAYETVLHDIRQSRPSTRILAREWLLAHAPPNSKIGQEWYTAPLAGTHFEVVMRNSLADDQRLLSDYYEEGFDYLVVSSGMYWRFYANPERSAPQISFYDSLAVEAVLVQQFSPSRVRGGPTIKIYRLSLPNEEDGAGQLFHEVVEVGGGEVVVGVAEDEQAALAVLNEFVNLLGVEALQAAVGGVYLPRIGLGGDLFDQPLDVVVVGGVEEDGKTAVSRHQSQSQRQCAFPGVRAIVDEQGRAAEVGAGVHEEDGACGLGNGRLRCGA
jgi:4-amino-4-deoxy-L-arabinose transferase-like glycosyltransferase